MRTSAKLTSATDSPTTSTPSASSGTTTGGSSTAAVNKTWWPQTGPMERAQYTSNYNIYWGQTKILRSWQVDQGVTLDWRNRWTTSLDYTEEFKRFEKDFRNRQTEIAVGYNTRAYQSVTGAFATGRNFDADFQLWSAAGNWKVTERLSAEYEFQRLFLEPDPRDESTWIHVAARQPVLHARPPDPGLLPDQLGDRPAEHSSGVHLSLSAAVRTDPGGISAGHGRVRTALRPGEHALPQADDGPLDGASRSNRYFRSGSEATCSASTLVATVETGGGQIGN